MSSEANPNLRFRIQKDAHVNTCPEGTVLMDSETFTPPIEIKINDSKTLMATSRGALFVTIRGLKLDDIRRPEQIVLDVYTVADEEECKVSTQWLSQNGYHYSESDAIYAMVNPSAPPASLEEYNLTVEGVQYFPLSLCECILGVFYLEAPKPNDMDPVWNRGQVDINTDDESESGYPNGGLTLQDAEPSGPNEVQTAADNNYVDAVGVGIVRVSSFKGDD